MRLYTNGFTDYERIRTDGRIYVDKTDLIYSLTQESSFVFLSRPRRFGKSLLCSTLKYYFQGRKDLFEGLSIMNLEKKWNQHPVMHFDMSTCKHKSDENVIKALNLQLEDYEALYGRNEEEVTPGLRLKGVIRRAHKMTGLKTVVIIDEYDAPLLDVLNKPERLESLREILQEFYQTLKICDADEQFVFITGITKFSQLSIFSTINNLDNISMVSRYSAICGFTKEELFTYYKTDIQDLANKSQTSFDQILDKLKLQYDGYHFGKDSKDIYNPYSLVKAFWANEIGSYWFSSGTPTFLFEVMRRFHTNVLELGNLEVPSSQFDVPTEGMTSALPLLYQSGYLTIKSYNPERNKFTLGFPNAEVKVGFMENFLSTMMGVNQSSRGFADDFYFSLNNRDINGAMKAMQAFYASIPYLEFGQKELEDIAKYEAYYQVLTYVVFSTINCRTFTEVKAALGRTDLVVFLSDTIYVMELKTRGTAQEALDCINSRDYAIPYQTDGRKVVKIGIAFSKETRTVEDWQIDS